MVEVIKDWISQNERYNYENQTQSWDIFVRDTDGSCAGTGVSRNPADFNRSFVTKKNKQTNKKGYIIRYGDGRYVGSEYCEEWARYRPGEGVGEHVTWHAEGGESPFWMSFPRPTSVLVCSCFTAMVRTFYYFVACADALHVGCLFTIEERFVVRACVNEEGWIGQMYDEIRAKFALLFGKTFPKMSDLTLRLLMSYIYIYIYIYIWSAYSWCF